MEERAVARLQAGRLSIALGSYEVSPLEMASAYSVFAARGLHVGPTPVVRITRGREVIEDNTVPGRGEQVLQAGVADSVNQILRGVITAGTGARANIGVPAAGKTGTSQNYENAWFVGYTPALATAVWVGHAEGNIPMRRIHGLWAVAGGTIPARIWHDFMAVALRGVPPTDFAAPGPFETAAVRERRAERDGVDPGAEEAGTLVVPPLPPYYPDPPLPEAVPPLAGGA